MYRILGSATLMYNLHVYFSVMPQVGLVALLICAAHLDPFSVMCASCCVHLRCWLRITPRYWVFMDGSIVPCGSVSVGHGLVLFWWVKSISASLLYSSGELCVLDQLATLPSLVTICANCLCASMKLLAIARSSASSMYAIADSVLLCGMSRMLAL